AVLIETFAIDAHRGGHDDAADLRAGDLLEENSGAKVVGADIASDLVHRLADTDFGGQMHNHIDIDQRRSDHHRVAHITPKQLYWRIKLGFRAPVHLVDQAVEHADLIAIVEEFPG